MNRRHLLAVYSLLLFSFFVSAQDNQRITAEKCGTMKRLEQRFAQDAMLKARFERNRLDFNSTVSLKKNLRDANTESTTYIPVVFHIVMTDPSLVTDAQIQAQLDTLNRDFFGVNGDSTNIPPYFKTLFGKSVIQFCLAQRTPDAESTNGIVRITTTTASFGIDDAIKHSYSNGDDSWNTDNYFNVWICALSNGILGYSTFPDDGSPKEQGVVIDYRSLPGGSFTGFNAGKTLTHETGHYFNLYHIWGDDNGSCDGTDYVDDTPNQADATSGCYSGIKTDACTSGGNGIMYQNYMDYSDDGCLVMFTPMQVARMEAALNTYRSTLLSSDGCQPVVVKNYDAQIKAINQPVQRLCSANFTPQVTIRNRGSQVLTSLQISTQIDNGPINSFQWTGSLPVYTTANVTLNNLTTTPGSHLITVYVSNPNNNADQNTTNDTLRINVQYYLPVTQVKEGFESSTFPPTAWDVVNPDGDITWQRVTTASKTGIASAMIDNYDYPRIGQKDDLRMPVINVPAGTDSAFLSFQIAAATYTATSTAGNMWDSLEVLISTDCGQSYTSLYKKWGSTLVTRKTETTDAFYPTSSEWRKDSINLANYIGNSNLLITFRNTTGFENNIYLDDINLRTVVINPNLKAQGFLVTPNPTNGLIAVQFYPQPVNLKGIELIDGLGRKIAEVIVANGQANNYYSFDLGRYAAGTYIVRAIFNDRVIIRKVVKY